MVPQSGAAIPRSHCAPSPTATLGRSGMGHFSRAAPGQISRASKNLIADYVLESTGKPAIVAGFYEDRFVKDGGRWYFAERRIHVFHAMEPPKAAESVPGR